MLRKNDVLLVDERKKVDKRLEKIIKDYDQELLYVHIRFNTFLRYAYFEILTAISKLYKYNNILNDRQLMFCFTEYDTSKNQRNAIVKFYQVRNYFSPEIAFKINGQIKHPLPDIWFESFLSLIASAFLDNPLSLHFFAS